MKKKKVFKASNVKFFKHTVAYDAVADSGEAVQMV